MLNNFPENIENKLGFDQIRDSLKNNCLCPLGVDEIDTMKFSTRYQEVSTELTLVEEFRQILLMDVPFPADNFVNGIPILQKLRIEGQFIDIDDIVLLRKSLFSFRNLSSFFKKPEHHQAYPVLTGLCASLNDYPYLTGRIDRLIDQNNRIKDNASEELQKLRKQRRNRESQVHAKIAAVLKQAIKDDIAESGATASFRNGRPVIPVPAAHKKRLRGLVHDESASGKTVFIEPSSIVELTNEIKELEYAEQREIRRLLIELANDIRPYSAELTSNYKIIGKIDAIRAKALYARKINGVKPVFNEHQVIEWYQAYHPLLLLQNQVEEKKTIPLSIKLTSNEHLLVISGPNAGGKSVCLKTVGLLQYMIQCGLLVPVKEGSEFGVFDNILLDIGDEQSIENDLSTYSSHLVAMKMFMQRGSNRSIVLIDEFGSGTEPILGGAIAESVLEHLTEQNVFGVITTHYANIKHYASSTPGIINGAMMFDLQKLEPTYELSTGRPGSSFAFEIARKIGLPDQVIKNAQEKVGSGHIDFDKNLRNIQRDKLYWQKKRDSIKTNEKKLSNILERYDKELEDVKKLKKDILHKAKVEADLLMSEANKRIEQTIREIKEAQAEKEKTKAIREQFDSFRMHNETASNNHDLEHKQNQIKHRKTKLARHNPDLSVPGKKQPESQKESIEPGDLVQLNGQDPIGEVMEVNNKSVMVAFGQMITTINASKLQKVSKNQAKKLARSNASVKTSLSINKRKLSFSPNLDVRGQRADDAMQKVSDFIDEAIMVGSKNLRVLHGKGNGILREVIRDFLKTVDVVADFRDEQIDLGGSGITLITLEL